MNRTKTGDITNTFKIFAPLLKASRGSDGKMRLHGIASSTVKDRHGDTIMASALDDMERSANNRLTIFLNHSYEVPEDVAGYVEHALIRSHPQDPDIRDLSMDIVVNDKNERAVKAWEAIDGGTQLGLSIGAMIPDGGATRNRQTGSYEIAHVELLETSLVGVPANPRSWVEYAVKSLNISWADPDAEDGLAVRSDGEVGMVVTSSLEQVDLVEAAADGTEVEIVTGEEIPQTELHNQDDGNPASEGKDVPVREDDPTVDAEPTVIEGISPPTTTTNSADITNATVNITTPFADISIDTGNRGGKATASDGASQEAPVSDPGNEDDDAPEQAPQNPWAALLNSVEPADQDITAALRLLEPTVVASLHNSTEVLAAVTSELIDTRAALEKRNGEYERLTVLADKVMKDTSELLDKLSTTPVGRRAVVREVNDKFASLESVYSKEFLDLLRRS